MIRVLEIGSSIAGIASLFVGVLQLVKSAHSSGNTVVQQGSVVNIYQVEKKRKKSSSFWILAGILLVLFSILRILLFAGEKNALVSIGNMNSTVSLVSNLLHSPQSPVSRPPTPVSSAVEGDEKVNPVPAPAQKISAKIHFTVSTTVPFNEIKVFCTSCEPSSTAHVDEDGQVNMQVTLAADGDPNQPVYIELQYRGKLHRFDFRLQDMNNIPEQKPTFSL